jgi:hypothetical protein
MRTTARLLTGTARAAAALGLLLGPTVASTSAFAGDFGALEISPSSAAPGETVTVNTTACGGEGGVGDASEVGAGEFDMEPATHKEVAVGKFTVPYGAKPRTYLIAVECDNGKQAQGDLQVKAGGGGGQGTGHIGQVTGPSGHVKSGVGGSIGPDSTQIAAGVAVLAAAAVGGSWLLRRRASGARRS